MTPCGSRNLAALALVAGVIAAIVSARRRTSLGA